jgi:hypothetical protein
MGAQSVLTGPQPGSCVAELGNSEDLLSSFNDFAVRVRRSLGIGVCLQESAEAVGGLVVPRIAVQEASELNLCFAVPADVGQANPVRVPCGYMVGVLLEEFLQQRYCLLRPSPTMQITRLLIQRPALTIT